MKQTFMFDGQFYGLAQILESQIISILYFALYFIHTDTALIAAVVPQVHVEYPIAPLFGGE